MCIKISGTKYKVLENGELKRGKKLGTLKYKYLKKQGEKNNIVLSQQSLPALQMMSSERIQSPISQITVFVKHTEQGKSKEICLINYLLSSILQLFANV